VTAATLECRDIIGQGNPPETEWHGPNWAWTLGGARRNVTTSIRCHLDLVAREFPQDWSSHGLLIGGSAGQALSGRPPRRGGRPNGTGCRRGRGILRGTARATASMAVRHRAPLAALPMLFVPIPCVFAADLEDCVTRSSREPQSQSPERTRVFSPRKCAPSASPGRDSNPCAALPNLMLPGWVVGTTASPQHRCRSRPARLVRHKGGPSRSGPLGW
jgi:hypothetical protein